MPTETKLGGSGVAGDLGLPPTLLLPLAAAAAVLVEMELSFTMKPPEAASSDHFHLFHR